KGELAAAVGPSDHAEAAADAGDPRPHGHAFADEERRPGLRARAGAADLPAGPLLDAPVVERQLPARREDVPERLRRALDDRRRGGGRGGDGERESSGEGGEGENETHVEQSTGRGYSLHVPETCTAANSRQVRTRTTRVTAEAAAPPAEASARDSWGLTPNTARGGMARKALDLRPAGRAIGTRVPRSSRASRARGAPRCGARCPSGSA